MKRLSLFLLLMSSTTFGDAPSTEKWLVDLEKSNTTVEFKAIGRPSALKIHGKGGSPKGVLTVVGTTLTGEASFALEKLDTGIKLRNEHMKTKYLEVGKYPEAKFKFTKLTLPDSFKDDSSLSDKVPFEGLLLLHGVEKPIFGLARIEKKQKVISVDADFGLNLSEFSISTPSFAGITMAEEVQVVIQFSGPFVNVQ